MTVRRSVLGLCMLCALAFTAFAAQAAHAEVKGTTLFTCKPVANGTGNFKGAHCKEGDAGTGPGANWEHVPFAENTTTEITGTSTETTAECKPTILRSTQSGVTEELKSPCAHLLAEDPGGSGQKSWVTNKKDPVTGEHYFEGEGWLDYTEVEVVKPAVSCQIKGATHTITTAKLKFTTKGIAEKHEIKFEPTSGTVFTTFEVEGCTIGALNGIYEVKGTVTGSVNGATVSTTEAGTTEQGTLTLRGQKAGLEGIMTVRGTDKAAGDIEDTPLSPTTVNTP